MPINFAFLKPCWASCLVSLKRFLYFLDLFELRFRLCLVFVRFWSAFLVLFGALLELVFDSCLPVLIFLDHFGPRFGSFVI